MEKLNPSYNRFIPHGQPREPLYPIGQSNTTGRRGSLKPGVYALLGYVHERTGPVTEQFIRAVVWKGTDHCLSRPGIQEQIYNTARDKYADINGECCCVRGRQGSWVRFGPMDNDHLEKSKRPFFELHDELSSRWVDISGGFLVVIVVYVNVEGCKVVREWSSIGEPTTGTASPFKQNKISRYFN